MGLVATGIGFLTRLFGGAAAVAAPAARRVATSTAGRVALGIGGAVAGGAAFEAGAALIGGDGAAGAPAIQAVLDAGGQATTIAGGRIMVTAPNGDFQLFTRDGRPIRPSLIIPAGQRLPGGAIVVSTRQNGALIGITLRRRRRKFATEAKRVRDVLTTCKTVLAAARK